MRQLMEEENQVWNEGFWTIQCIKSLIYFFKVYTDVLRKTKQQILQKTLTLQDDEFDWWVSAGAGR